MSKLAFFDRVAVSADPLLFTESDRHKIPGLRTRLGDLSGQRVLEPGCGAGPLTAYLSEWVGAAGRVLAFDSIPAMVETCRRRLPDLANVTLLRADVETISVADGAWDLVLLFRVFPHLDDKDTCLRRLRPCLAPRGRLVIANLEGSTRLNALHAGFSEPVRHDHMPCAHGTRRLLEGAGYRVVTLLDDEEAFFAEALADAPAVMAD